MKGKFSSKVLEAWFSPAVLLMSRLTYVSKFAVATALFAVPLILVVINETVEHFHKIELLERKLIAVQRLDDIQKVSRHIAVIRNNRARTLLHPEPSIDSDNDKHKTAVLEALDVLEGRPSIVRNNLIKLAISNLAMAVVSGRRNGGTEGDSIYSVFSGANDLVVQTHRLGMLIVSEAGLLNDDDVLSLNIASFLMTELQLPLESFGKIESFGAYFLEKGYLDSQSVLVFSSIFTQLDASYLVMSQNLSSIFERFKAANQTGVIDISLLEVISQLQGFSEDMIILDPDLEISDAEYRVECQRLLESMYKFQDQLIEYLQYRYQARINNLKIDQWQRALSIGVLVFGAMYLFMGIFYSVEHSLLQLISAAERVSSGDLDTKVEIKTRDELYQLARVFEDMRIQLKARDQALFDLAITDGLTGLFNRKYFNDCINIGLKNSSRSNSELTLVIIDIDFFKNLNDTYGHQIGDTCLIEMGKILTAVLARETDLAFRYGGEEFAVILPNMSSKECIGMVRKIWQAIRESEVIVGVEAISFTASLGVASSDLIGSYDVFSIIQAADKALYIAKDKGRDCYVVAGDINESLIENSK
ncbi:hypothetical protein A9Q81_27695 [Gammaproteobacteria bacterium 42_54_T18]|nr:hypothetical protein A9Q81_27695 [Gammaproteobacteria bacterium 42_54_T18]